MKFKRSLIKELIAEVKEEYQTFFKAACKKFGIDPEDIDNIDKDKKKELFSYIDKNWNMSSKKGKDGGVMNEASEFDFSKVMKLINNDEFLKYIFISTKGKNDKTKAEIIFNNHILGDKDLEKKYNGR